MSDDNFMAGLVSAKDAVLLSEEDIPWDDDELEKQQKNGTIVTQQGEALWSYRNENKINGITVKEEDRDLFIERDDQLPERFRPHYIPHSKIFWLSPDDVEQNAEYEKLLQDVYDGKAIIRDEQKHYDDAKAKFMVLLRYDEVCYELHPRYAYLKEESK